MSKYYLCHVFKENMGVSVFNYLIWLRMEGSPPPAGHHHPEGVAGGQPGGLRRPQLFHHGLQKQEGVTPTEYRAGQTVRRLNAE